MAANNDPLTDPADDEAGPVEKTMTRTNMPLSVLVMATLLTLAASAEQPQPEIPAPRDPPAAHDPCEVAIPTQSRVRQSHESYLRAKFQY